MIRNLKAKFIEKNSDKIFLISARVYMMLLKGPLE